MSRAIPLSIPGSVSYADEPVTMYDRLQPAAFKRQVAASFDRTSTGYGTPGDFHWEFARRLVERAPLGRGQRILDVAAGTAPAALMAAQRVGNRGAVIGVDLSPGVLQLAQRNIRAAKVSNIALVCGDAEQLAFHAGHFDGIVCSSAIVWFPDILRALREWYRVVRDGGWIAFSCFGGLARQTINDLVIRLLKPYGAGYPELNTPLNSPEKCRELAEQAGFTHVTVQVAQAQQLTTDPEASFAQAWATSSRFGISLTPAEVGAIKAQYITLFGDLAHAADHWNHDYEQHVVAYKLACVGKNDGR